MKEPCGHCGKWRKLRRITVRHLGQERKLDMCRPCHLAVKEAIKHAAA